MPDLICIGFEVKTRVFQIERLQADMWNTELASNAHVDSLILHSMSE